MIPTYETFVVDILSECRNTYNEIITIFLKKKQLILPYLKLKIVIRKFVSLNLTILYLYN